eukprot:TRINITY_DN1141_c0_g1_i2.p1 TRINITY_DN1141_c0_g1~~TRINITY_DN1141_c0_g1_i2.p1  ORF type:complete len:707 (+),score=135.18 TRINITY_DN1141_c0_g1_i2:49-2121(+)
MAAYTSARAAVTARASSKEKVGAGGEYAPGVILVTGAAGFIASNFVNMLGTEYPAYRIIGFDALKYCASVNNIDESLRRSSRFKIIQGDIRSSDFVSHILRVENVDTVIHFAAQTHVDNSFGNSASFTQVNVEGTHNLLECCKAYGKIRRFIHVSTDEVYGENPDMKHMKEHSVIDPTNPYAATKAAAEMICRSYLYSFRLPVIMTRGNNVYGERQFPEKLIPKFCLLALRDQPLWIHGDGKQQRSFLHAADTARAFLTILHKGTTGEIYNIGTTQDRSVLQVAEDILKLVPNTKSKIQHVEDRKFNDQRYFIDPSKLEALGWKPQVQWEDGLRRTLEWFRSVPDGYWPAMNSVLCAHPKESGGSILDVDSSQKLDEGKSEEPPAKRARANTADLPRFLIFGRTGWLGGILGELCKQRGLEYRFAQSRLDNAQAMQEELDSFRPTHVLNAAGLTGRPNVDWCEDHRVETNRVNVIGTLALADVTHARGIHMTNFATGCIFHYDDEHPMPEPGTRFTGKGFKESDRANFTGSYYSRTKGMVEELLEAYDNVLTLRVRMPIGDDLEWPRNFIYKIAHYNKVVNIPNSMTVLPELMPMSIDMALRKLKGVMNFTNPGVISHNEVLDLYREYYKPDHKYSNFTLEEQAKVIKAGRSNNELDTTRLKTEFPEVLDIKSSLIKYVFEPARKKKAAN